MGMYSLIEDDFNKRLAALIASGVSEEDAYERLREEDEKDSDR